MAKVADSKERVSARDFIHSSLIYSPNPIDWYPDCQLSYCFSDTHMKDLNYCRIAPQMEHSFSFLKF